MEVGVVDWGEQPVGESICFPFAGIVRAAHDQPRSNDGGAEEAIQCAIPE
jgi:hypothetical protein